MKLAVFNHTSGSQNNISKLLVTNQLTFDRLASSVRLLFWQTDKSDSQSAPAYSTPELDIRNKRIYHSSKEVTIRQPTQLRFLAFVLSCFAIGAFVYLRLSVSTSTYTIPGRFQSTTHLPTQDIPVIPREEAMQSVKIVEAVSKQTGTVIFLHVSEVLNLCTKSG